MLAYQMIYTACGKEKTGAFSLWAKSQNVTAEEWRAIETVMIYRKESDVPDLPSPHELETRCPKKYGYFVLPTGRKCVAQSSYIGQVYSDEDNRLGNYIIHAYIFDDMGEFRPSSIFASPLFKTHLTDSEWRADAPDDLPQVNLPEGFGNVSENEVKAFVNANPDVAASLLQAMINSTSDNKMITFNDTERNQAVIYTLLNMLLPKNIYEQATFSTQYAPASQMSIDQAGVELKVRNVFFNQGGSMVFNYQEEKDVGEQYVFSFDEKIYSNVTPGLYVTNVLNTFRTEGLVSALRKVEEVCAIAKQANCDLDAAMSLYYIGKRNFLWFNSVSAFSETLEKAVAARILTKESAVPQIYTDIVKPKRWGYNDGMFALTKLVFDNSNNAVKDEIIDEYYQNMDKYGVNTTAAPKEFVVSFKNSAPFAWEDFVACILRNTHWETRIGNANTLALNYLFYAAMAAAWVKGGDSVSNYCYKNIYNIFVKSWQKKSLDEMKLYFACGRETSLGAKIEKSLMDNLESVTFAKPLNDNELSFALELIFALGDENEQLKHAEQILLANQAAPAFLPKYVSLCKQHTAFFAKLEARVKNKGELKEFYERKYLYEFEREANLTKDKLNEYFARYYKTGRDNGLYFKKLQQYLDNCSKKEGLSEAFDCYQTICTLNTNFADVQNIIVYLESKIYEDEKALEKVFVNYRTLLADLNNRLDLIGKKTTKKYERMETLLLIQGAFGKEERRKAIGANELYKKIPEKQFVTFVHNNIDDILVAFLEERKECKKEETYAALVLSMFYPIFMNPEVEETRLVKALEGLKGSGLYEVMAEWMVYSYNEENPLATEIKQFVESYKANQKKGELKKFYKKIAGELKDRDPARAKPVLDEANGYQETHPGGFANLIKMIFGGGKKSQEKQDGKDLSEEQDEEGAPKKKKKAKPEDAEEQRQENPQAKEKTKKVKKK